VSGRQPETTPQGGTTTDDLHGKINEHDACEAAHAGKPVCEGFRDVCW
jgi:hypothetical protein